MECRSSTLHIIVWASSILGCGHGSFSDNPLLNSVVGHLLHSSILVPYHGWRISHRTHHQNHGHVENDESWVPLPEKIYKTLDESTKILRFKVPFSMFAYPIYLWTKSPGKTGSHFNGFPAFLPPHGVWIFVMWLDTATYLHHHGYEQKLPWYHGKGQVQERIKHQNTVSSRMPNPNRNEPKKECQVCGVKP
ncbi:hypothetical protein ACSBR2_005466 [Camellia fascicularis]